MLTDIFSSFDPAVCSLHSPSMVSSSVFWAMNFFTLSLTLASLWAYPNRLYQLFLLPVKQMFDQATRTGLWALKGSTTSISTLFILLISVNLSGLMPYVFSLTSHLLFTLTFGLPLWLAYILSSAKMSPYSFAATFLPSGAPGWLSPFLVVVETISISVRPATLSFRLAANMSAGHIVLGLMGLYAASAMFTSMSAFLALTIIQVGYILFELGICMIQAYIFCLLLSLYSSEHT